METTLWNECKQKPKWIFFLMHKDMHEIHYNEIKLCKQIWTIKIRSKCNENIFFFWLFLKWKVQKQNMQIWYVKFENNWNVILIKKYFECKNDMHKLRQTDMKYAIKKWQMQFFYYFF